MLVKLKKIHMIDRLRKVNLYVIRQENLEADLVYSQSNSESITGITRSA